MATNTYALINRVLGGHLQDLLSGWRTEGISYPEMAYKLRSEHDIAVSDETLRRWVKDFDNSVAS